MVSQVYLVPNGPKNLKSVFPSINFENVDEYYLELIDEADQVVATTVKNKLGCCCGADKIRIHFLQYLGKFDALNFPKPKVVHDYVGSTYEKGLMHPLDKTDTGTESFDVRSNDTYEAKIYCNEEHMPYLQELVGSPKLLFEWRGTEGQSDSYIPVVKVDGKFEKLKNVEEYRYEFVVVFKLSNPYINLRN